jgi:hypothetical protein
MVFIILPIVFVFGFIFFKQRKTSKSIVTHCFVALPYVVCIAIFAYQNYSTPNQNNCNTNYSKELVITYIVSTCLVLATALYDVVKWSRRPHFKQIGPVMLTFLSIIGTVIAVAIITSILLLGATFCIPF